MYFVNLSFSITHAPDNLQDSDAVILRTPINVVLNIIKAFDVYVKQNKKKKLLRLCFLFTFRNV